MKTVTKGTKEEGVPVPPVAVQEESPKDEQSDINKSPSDNNAKEEGVKKMSEETIVGYTITVAGANELAEILNQVNLNAHIKQAIFNQFNQILKPITK